MNRKIRLLYLVLVLMPSGLFAQGPCLTPPNCIINGNLVTNGGVSGNMEYGNNPSLPNTINGWFVSGGDPTLWASAPGNPGSGVWMWSYASSAERIFTCFNFQAGHTYKVCFQVKNTSAENRGNLMVVAANGLNMGNPVPANQQIINGSQYHNPSWTTVSFQFTANQAYSQLSIYPFWAGNSDSTNNWMQYELVVDDIRVMEVPILNSTKDTISMCDSSQLRLINLGPNVTGITWSPAAGLNTTQGARVTAKPCSTTTYTATIAGSCPSCFSTLQHTVVVKNNGYIVNSTPNIFCGGSINLSFNDSGCKPVSYSWTNPANTIISNASSISIPIAGAFDAGTYQLDVQYPNGCNKTYFTGVNVTGCCSVKTDFNMNGCNPVRFEDITGGASGGTVVGWMWEFADGATSTLKNPAHLYTTILGDTTVCLTTIYVNGTETCCDKVCKKLTVCDWSICAAKASFGVSNINSSTFSAQFTDFSAGGTSACGFFWDFGDGTSDFSQNPNHTFPGPGTYHVCFTVTYCPVGSGGPCYDTWCEDIVIP